MTDLPLEANVCSRAVRPPACRAFFAPPTDWQLQQRAHMAFAEVNSACPGDRFHMRRVLRAGFDEDHGLWRASSQTYASYVRA